MVPLERVRQKMKNRLLKIAKFIGILSFLCILYIFSINLLVKKTTSNQILQEENLSQIQEVDAILVLGAGIWGISPSPMLEDRILTAIELYEKGISSKIIMSGDHTKKDYDEVNVMKNYAIKKGIASNAIFMDHAGISSYDSIYRAKEIFGVKKIIIVTQKYHLYRALFIAKKLGIEAYGVSANLREYTNQSKREIREILARNKDFLKSIFKPQSTYLGDSIPINGSGDITNDY